MPQTVDKLENLSAIFLLVQIWTVGWNVGHSVSVGGSPSAHLRLWGFPWTRYSRRSLAHPLQSTMFKNLYNTPFAYSLFCFKIELLKLEMMSLLSKHNSIQRDQLE